MCVESRLAFYPLIRQRSKREIISCRKQEIKLVDNYKYMPNRLQ